MKSLAAVLLALWTALVFAALLAVFLFVMAVAAAWQSLDAAHARLTPRRRS